MRTRSISVLLLLLAAFLLFSHLAPATEAASVSSITDNSSTYPNREIPLYRKFEITFGITNTTAQNFQMPYDPNPPAGIQPDLYPKHNGISVDAQFLPPGQTDWNTAYLQPAFIYQPYDTNGVPSGDYVWKVRFSPHQTGTWQYRIVAEDNGGINQSSVQSFTVIPSSQKGFIKVSQTDPRYFEYGDGSYFPALGRQGISYYNYPTVDNIAEYTTFGQNQVKLIRAWMSGFYGAAWLQWIGTRNAYDGYLPRSGLEAIKDPGGGKEYISMVVDYNSNPDTGADWYDACRVQFHNAEEPIKANTNYRVRVTYQGSSITGPRIPSFPNYGLVAKIGGWTNNCHDPGNIPVVTTYGKNTTQWTTIEGTWNSGINTRLPRLHISLENATSGKTWIREISVREELAGGQFGSEILTEPSLEYESYFPERSAYEIDQAIALAEQNDIYFKLVIMDKDDMVWSKINNDGSLVTTGSDNSTGFYGNWRSVNKTRWLQNAYFRYLQARWGYSTAIHSWELTNEGDPWNGNHWALTDEMGKEFHCRIFGIPIGQTDSQKCTYNHPNRHMVTTSFWHSFPGEQFWGNQKYPNIDYADVHAYISTGWLNNSAYESDEALFHWDYAKNIRNNLDWYSNLNAISTKPIVRGETGLDYLTQQTEHADLPKDTQGIWLHNLSWSSLDPYAMTELYWWKETLDSKPGPDGNTVNGLHEIYRHFFNFIEDLPLNNGHYQDISATVSNPNIRIAGQKDIINGNAHLWIQNKQHTWKNVVDNVSITSQSGTITIGGFTPGNIYRLEPWNTYTGTPQTTTDITADNQGILTITVSNLTTDTAYKILNPSQSTVTETPTPTPLPGDANGDRTVNILDYQILANTFGSTIDLRADFNASGNVNILDYQILANNFGNSG